MNCFFDHTAGAGVFLCFLFCFVWLFEVLHTFYEASIVMLIAIFHHFIPIHPRPPHAIRHIMEV